MVCTQKIWFNENKWILRILYFIITQNNSNGSQWLRWEQATRQPPYFCSFHRSPQHSLLELIGSARHSEPRILKGPFTNCAIILNDHGESVRMDLIILCMFQSSLRFGLLLRGQICLNPINLTLWVAVSGLASTRPPTSRAPLACESADALTAHQPNWVQENWEQSPPRQNLLGWLNHAFFSEDRKCVYMCNNTYYLMCDAFMMR